MEARQRVVKARTKAQTTPKLFDLLSKFSNKNSNVSQKSVKSRVRTDGKSKGVAIRKK